MSPSARKTPAESSSTDPSSSNSKGWDAMPDIRTSAMSAAATSGPPVHAPSVTVFTNIAGAVSVRVDQAGIDAGHRLRSCLLPESLFNPFRGRRSKIKRGVVGRDADTRIPSSSSEVISQRRKAGQPELPSESSAAAASASANGIKDGVREALDRWALQTSRRESTVLWRHECSRYASSSRIGYHHNHPSSSRPGSRPSSAATILRAFSAQQQQQQQQRPASSAPRPSSVRTDRPDAGGREEGSTPRGGTGARPRSAVPRLGVSSRRQGTEDEEETESVHASRRRRGASASGRVGGARGGGGATGGSGRSRGGSSARLPAQPDDLSLEAGIYDDIYDDMDDEDDGELDNRISIMERRFSSLGRERPTSARQPLLDDGAPPAANDVDVVDAQARQARRVMPRSARRPPLAPPQQLSSNTTTTSPPMARRRLVSAAAAAAAAAAADGAVPKTGGTFRDGAKPPPSFVAGEAHARRVIRSRPTSAPASGSGTLFSSHRGGRVTDPLAALRARRMRLQLSSAGTTTAGAGTAGAGAGAAAADVAGGVNSATVLGGEGQGRAGDGHGKSQPRTRDVKTAVPSWDRGGDGGGRPLSSATTDVNNNNNDDDNNINSSSAADVDAGCGSRPSSAAFRRWVDARPSARSAVSAVSSARTLGMDDPELVHLQLEMESRRGGMSESTLARMEDHYKAVVFKSDNQGKRGRSLSPRKGGAKTSSPRQRGVVSAGASRKGGNLRRTSSPRRGGASSPSTVSQNKGGKRKTTKEKKKNKKGKRRGRSEGGKDGSGKAGAGVVTTPRKVYPSAKAFMAEHFPREEPQGMSLLGLEQQEECHHALRVLSRAGVSVSSEALRRALVIPTDRPLEECLAALPEPLEGLRDKPFLELPSVRVGPIKISRR